MGKTPFRVSQQGLKCCSYNEKNARTADLVPGVFYLVFNVAKEHRKKLFFLQRWPKLISIFGWNGSYPDFKIALHLLSSLEELKRGLFFKMENLETFRLKR